MTLATETRPPAARAPRPAPVATHADNCAKVRDLLAGRADADLLADILGLNDPETFPEPRDVEPHHHHTRRGNWTRTGAWA